MEAQCDEQRRVNKGLELEVDTLKNDALTTAEELRW